MDDIKRYQNLFQVNFPDIGLDTSPFFWILMSFKTTTSRKKLINEAGQERQLKYRKQFI